MNIQSATSQVSIPNTFRSLPKAESASISQDKFTMVEPPPVGYNPSAPVPGAKWIVGAVAAAAAGALGAYAGYNTGTGAIIAGSLAGGIAGGVGLGTVGLMADLGAGFMGSSNKTKPAALTGAAIGGVAGGLVGAFSSNPVAGVALGVAAALTGGFVATAFADEKLPK